MHGVGQHVCGSVPVYDFLSSFLSFFLPFFLFFVPSWAAFFEIRHLISIEVMCIVTGVPGTNRQYRNNTPSSMEADMLYL